MKLIHVGVLLPVSILSLAFGIFFLIHPLDVINNSINLHNATITKYLNTGLPRFQHDSQLTTNERITILQSQHLINSSQLAQIQILEDAKYYDLNTMFWMQIGSIPFLIFGFVGLSLFLLDAKEKELDEAD